VIIAGDPDYDAARQIWNLAFEHRPRMIVACASASDVAATLRLASRESIGVSVTATGHGVARVADDAILILTRSLQQLDIDPVARTARVGAGVKWGAVLARTQEYGLAPLLGSAGDVGAVGYTLGGGIGWLARKHGLSADHVRSFEVVTVDGAVLNVSSTEHPDLFWALRGAGAGTFVVVTAMEIDLVPVTDVYAGNLLYPAEDAKEVMARWRDWIASVPDELTSSLVLMNFPPIDLVPEPVRGRSFVMVRGCWCGPLDEGAAQLAYWRQWREPAMDMWGQMPFAAAETISNDPVDPVPSRSTTEWLRHLDDTLIADLVGVAFTDGPPPVMMLEIRHVGGAVADQSPDATPHGNRVAELLLFAAGILPFPEARPAVDAQLDALTAALRPHVTGGAYLNFLDGPDRRTRTRSGVTPDAWSRLCAVKQAFDPQNILGYGLDIPTAGEAPTA
jgi:hypothetical protein